MFYFCEIVLLEEGNKITRYALCSGIAPFQKRFILLPGNDPKTYFADAPRKQGLSVPGTILPFFWFNGKLKKWNFQALSLLNDMNWEKVQREKVQRKRLKVRIGIDGKWPSLHKCARDLPKFPDFKTNFIISNRFSKHRQIPIWAQLASIFFSMRAACVIEGPHVDI